MENLKKFFWMLTAKNMTLVFYINFSHCFPKKKTNETFFFETFSIPRDSDVTKKKLFFEFIGELIHLISLKTNHKSVEK